MSVVKSVFPLHNRHVLHVRSVYSKPNDKKIISTVLDLFDRQLLAEDKILIVPAGRDLIDILT